MRPVNTHGEWSMQGSDAEVEVLPVLARAAQVQRRHSECEMGRGKPFAGHETTTGLDGRVAVWERHTTVNGSACELDGLQQL